MVRHLCNEKWIKLAHLEEVKVVTRLRYSKNTNDLSKRELAQANSCKVHFAEALAAYWFRCPERLLINNYWRLNASRNLWIFLDWQVYATLLNCWKFLRARLYQVEEGNFLDGSLLRYIILSHAWGMVIIKWDVTMDNQQPSPPSLFQQQRNEKRMPFTD